MNNNKVYIINSEGLARSIAYIGRINYWTEQDKFNSNRIVFIFKDNERFRKVLTLVNNMKKELN